MTFRVTIVGGGTGIALMAMRAAAAAMVMLIIVPPEVMHAAFCVSQVSRIMRVAYIASIRKHHAMVSLTGSEAFGVVRSAQHDAREQKRLEGQCEAPALREEARRTSPKFDCPACCGLARRDGTTL